AKAATTMSSSIRSAVLAQSGRPEMASSPTESRLSAIRNRMKLSNRRAYLPSPSTSVAARARNPERGCNSVAAISGVLMAPCARGLWLKIHCWAATVMIRYRGGVGNRNSVACALGFPVLKPLREHCEELVGALPVQDPVVDGQGDVATRANDQYVLAAIRADRRALFDLADAQNRRLRLVDDDRRGKQAAADAVVGNGERAAPHIRGSQAILARFLDLLAERARDAKQVQRGHIANH